MKSHTGGTMSWGKGFACSSSTKQKGMADSDAAAKSLVAHDTMP